MNLVDVRPLIPGAIFDLRYTTTNNVLGRVLHNDKRALLDEPAAERLVYAVKLLAERTFIPVFWDMHRTPEIQEQLLAHNSDPNYVLSADKSNHVKGLAVDMTLADLGGQQLDMGNDFDDFSAKAHLDTDQITPLQRANRLLLGNVMGMADFKQLDTEWWHFDFTAASR